MSPHDIATRWYFDLLKAELVGRGSAEAVPSVDRYLRAAPPASRDVTSPVVLTIQQQLTDYEVRLNANTGELISWFVDFLSREGDTSMPRASALELAHAIGQVPSTDVELEIADYEVMAGRTFFRARWKHLHEGLEVEGDYVEVLINGKVRRAFSVSRVWREPNLSGPAMVR